MLLHYCAQLRQRAVSWISFASRRLISPLFRLFSLFIFLQELVTPSRPIPYLRIGLPYLPTSADSRALELSPAANRAEPAPFPQHCSVGGVMLALVCQRERIRPVGKPALFSSPASSSCPINAWRNEEKLRDRDFSYRKLLSRCYMYSPLVRRIVRPPPPAFLAAHVRHRVCGQAVRANLGRPSHTAPGNAVAPGAGRIDASSFFKLRMTVLGMIRVFPGFRHFLLLVVCQRFASSCR